MTGHPVKGHLVKVGALAAVALALLGWFILHIEQLSLRHRAAVSYGLRLEDAQGLEEKSPVLLQGVRVGRVDALALKEGVVEGHLTLFREVPLREGSVAVVTSVGLLGEKQLELRNGPPDAPLLPAGATLPGRLAPSLDQVIGTVGEVGKDVRAVTRSVRETVASPEGQEQLAELVKSVVALTSQLERTLRENREEVHQTVSSIRDLSRATARLAARLEVLAERNQETVSESLTHLAEFSQHLAHTSENLDTVTGGLAQGEGTLGQLLTRTETGEKLNQALDAVSSGGEGVGGTLRWLGQTRLSLGVRADWLAAREAGKSYLQLEVLPPSAGFARLELVGRPQGGLVTERRLTEEREGVRTTVRQVVEEGNTLALSLQAGVRRGPLSLRAGLTESRPGAGGDVRLWAERVRLSADLWDFSRPGLRPHARLEGALGLLPGLYLVGGWDDPLNPGRTDSLFLGAGLRLESPPPEPPP